MTDEGPFVIWTRYVRPTGHVVRHAYGPYPTRSRALTALRRMFRDYDSYEDDRSRVEAYVTKLLAEEHS